MTHVPTQTHSGKNDKQTQSGKNAEKDNKMQLVNNDANISTISKSYY